MTVDVMTSIYIYIYITSNIKQEMAPKIPCKIEYIYIVHVPDGGEQCVKK